MNTNVIFKTIGFAGFVFGVGAMAFAVYKRNEKIKLQEATAEALVLTDMAKDIAKENFSGANGATARVKSYLCSDGKRKWFSRTPCRPTGGITPPPRTCKELVSDIGNLEIWIRENGTDPKTNLKLAQLKAQYKEMCGGNPLERQSGDYCETKSGSGTWQGTGGNSGYCRLSATNVA